MSDKISYKVTVVTVVFNDVAHIESTMLSVIGQTYKNIEYIVIDGKSNDGTTDLIKRYSDKVTKWISEPDKGIYDAMNKGLALATGDYVIFMNSGDKFIDNTVLEHVFRSVTGYPDVIYGHTIGIHKNGRLRQRLLPFFKSNEYCPTVGICHQSVLVKTDKAKKLMFDLSYKVCSDHKMLHDFYKAGAAFVEYKGDIAEIICDEGFSDKHLAMKLNERGRIYGINNDLRFKLFLLKEYAFNGLRNLFRLLEPTAVRNYRFRHKSGKV